MRRGEGDIEKGKEGELRNRRLSARMREKGGNVVFDLRLMSGNDFHFSHTQKIIGCK